MQNIGVIFGNRDFFPDHLVTEARKDVAALFAELEINPVMVSESDTKLGGIETFADAQRCADLFRAKGPAIEGILVVLPNFGDEKGVADTIRMSGLDCPVLVQAYPDELTRLDPAARRDGFCGKISVCNNLRQYGIPFSLRIVRPPDPCMLGFFESTATVRPRSTAALALCFIFVYDQ